MEVQRVAKTVNHKVDRKEKEVEDSISFTHVLSKKKYEVSDERYAQMLKDIEEQGEKLAKYQSIDSLRTYKKLVKKFIDTAVQNGLELKEQRGFSMRGGSALHKLVKEVDEKLVHLTNEVLSKEKEGLRILSMVGEIQGLLVNIYT
ncbi:YaaR family protein [Priestia abyssalis]|uniref:YaaR family protein n=1 Tax=Priestia abyssalis TaxID=1221450 RepID=UPI0009953FAA|nr:YaaR family protein [Priestia abyssalis]